MENIFVKFAEIIYCHENPDTRDAKFGNRKV